MSSPGSSFVILNPSYWIDRERQLAEILARRRGNSIADPSGRKLGPDEIAEVRGAGYWAEHVDELRSALVHATGGQSPGGVATGVGVTDISEGRLTLTVEEAAALLGISRAFAYEAVARGEIPSIRIGRRILVPRAALKRMLGLDSDSLDTE